ncbi:hypothetical protein [Pseudomonas muyukensis]|uniref:Type 1 fimbrial protein n=1 Tax=Pseudomonas muyukensis TaxID=2842357 RepID=A0ABX8MEI2_9PSED|nr:hypothetical protein [Pseudomonas muyukensis]QXH37489.1 hypothetical protein KSS95_11950 [Pseudomonas muyukensis]
MGIKAFAVCVVACLGWVAQAQAATAIGSGVLQFTGSIVESSCRAEAGAMGVRVADCPSTAQRSQVDVQRADRQVEQVQAMRADARGELYRLVDIKGQPLAQGNYVVILTAP